MVGVTVIGVTAVLLASRWYYFRHCVWRHISVVVGIGVTAMLLALLLSNL
jgi:hypothetical protein